MAPITQLLIRLLECGLPSLRRHVPRLFNRGVDLLCNCVYGCSVFLLRFLARVEANQRVRRSLWAGTPIVGMPINARAECLLGVKSDTLVWATYFLTDDFTYNLREWNERCPLWIRHWFPWFVLLWACFRYQRFHFYCDQLITPSIHRMRPREEELALLQSLGKEIYFYAYGADVRTQSVTRSLGEPNCCTECTAPGTACICSEQEQQANYQVLVRYATAIFSGGDCIYYTPGSRNDLYFLPIDLDADKGQRVYRPNYPDPASSALIRVVHAPNHRSFKGSHYVISAVKRLRSEGLPIELVLVERLPNRAALDLYRTADIVFDQCLIGWSGYFALEAMALGKPVMVYLRDPEHSLPAPHECPLINSPPDQVETILRELVRDRNRLHDVGVLGRQYVEKYYSLPAFAARLQRVYDEVNTNKRIANMRNVAQGMEHDKRPRKAA